MKKKTRLTELRSMILLLLYSLVFNRNKSLDDGQLILIDDSGVYD